MKKSSLFEPPGMVSRSLGGAIVVIAGLGCLLCYGLIEFDVCRRLDCDRLEITGFFARTPEIYLVYGFFVILAGIQLFRDDRMIRLYRLAIEISILAGIFLSVMILFGLLKEAARLT